MITFFAPLNNLGYGVHSYGLMKALDKQGVDLALITPNGTMGRQGTETIKKWIANVKLAKVTDPSVMIYHEQFLRQFSGNPRIGFPVFEVMNWTDRTKAIVESCDALLQPSKWGKKQLERIGMTNVHVVPEGYDDEIFFIDKGDKLACTTMQSGINFLHVGKWEKRKSQEEIVTAFTRAVEGQRRCCLTMRVVNDFSDWYPSVVSSLSNNGWQITDNKEYLMASRGLSTICVPKYKLPTQGQLASEMNNAHFGLFASKAEGWNLPLLEMMACGKPCFTTSWTGQSEFIVEGEYPEGFIFKESFLEKASDGQWFHGVGNWDCVSVSEMTEKIRLVVQDPEKYYIENSNKVAAIAKKFTWTRSATKFMRAMEDIWVGG